MSYLHTVIDTHKTPQTERLPHRSDQTRNSAGGYVWEVDDWTRLERFLILGSEGGTYYVQERALTLDERGRGDAVPEGGWAARGPNGGGDF